MVQEVRQDMKGGNFTTEGAWDTASFETTVAGIKNPSLEAPKISTKSGKKKTMLKDLWQERKNQGKYRGEGIKDFCDLFDHRRLY